MTGVLALAGCATLHTLDLRYTGVARGDVSAALAGIKNVILK